mgnify:CR=1 FL=1
MKHPMQPLEQDKDGVVRFKENKLVRFLLDSHPDQNLNSLSIRDQQGKFNKGDYTQFMQLIGYSASGYGDLGSSPKKIVKKADKLAAKMCKKKKK